MKKFSYQKINKALRDVQDDLLTGKIRDKSFNMNNSMTTSCNVEGNSCGSVGCIGGYTGIKLGLSEAEAAEFVTNLSGKSRLYMLFYPTNQGWDATPKHAILAIERFLAGGKNPWNNIKVRG